MAAEQETNKTTKFLKHKPEGKTELKCDKCGDDCQLYLCQDCNQPHSKNNKTHNIVPLHLVTGEEGAGQPTRKVITLVDEMIENLSKAKVNIVSTQEKIKEQANKIDQEIDKCYYEQLQELNKHHKQLKEQLHNAVLWKDEALKKQLEEMKSLQDELVGLKELHEELEKISNCKESSKKQQDVEDQLKKVSDQHKNLNTQPVESYTMAFNPSKEPCVQLGHLSDLTAEVHLMPKYAFVNKEVKIHILSKDGKGQNYPRGGSKIVVELQSSTGGITVGEIFDNNDGSYVASLVPKQVGDAKIVVSINEEQIKGRSYSIIL